MNENKHDPTILQRRRRRRRQRHKTLRFSLFVLALLLFHPGRTTTTTALSMTTTGSQQKTYDLVVVGGGSAGLTAAKLAGKTLKRSVVIVEANRLGGDCTWTGCVPSKSLLASAKAAHMARQWAIRSNDNKPPAAVDFHQVRDLFRTKQRLIYERDDSPEALKAFGVDTIHGRARLTSRHTLSVAMNDDESDEHTITARYGILWCTGATAKKQIDIPGLETVTVVTYEDVWQLESLPETLTVVGGGPVGCELAQALARLGSKVTMVAGRLLPREEPEVSRILQQVFEEDENITIVNGRLERVERNGPAGGHTAIVSLNEDSSKEIKVEGDVMLLSIGRTPNTRGMGLENVGVDLLDNGGISVNDRLQTSLKGVYAAGDCIGEKQFTHYAGYQGAIAARNILLPLTDPGVLSDVPASTFTSPEVASVGHSEASAKEKYGVDAVAVSKMNLEEVDRAVCDGATKGFLKVIYKKRGGKILGVTIMAPCAGELISEISVAKAAGMSFPSMAKAIHPYPSYAIALQMMASEAYYEEVGKYRAILDFLKRLGL